MATDPKSKPTDAPPSLSNYLNDRRFQRKLLNMIVKTPGATRSDSPPAAPTPPDQETAKKK